MRAPWRRWQSAGSTGPARPLSRGNKITAGMPAAAAYAASAAEVSPVEAQATALIGLPSVIICLHHRDQHGHAQVLKGTGMAVAAQLDPQVSHVDFFTQALRPEAVGIAFIQRDHVFFIVQLRANPFLFTPHTAAVRPVVGACAVDKCQFLPLIGAALGLSASISCTTSSSPPQSSHS